MIPRPHEDEILDAFGFRVIQFYRINDFTAMVLSDEGELFLVLADDEGEEELFPLGQGLSTLKAYQKAITHLLNHIN
jgi:hypothetical protein